MDTMQRSAAHSMRLRPRSNGLASQNENNRQSSRKTKPTVLGDISNRNQGEGSIKGNATKGRSTRIKTETSKRICMDESSHSQPVAKPRRLSARIQEQRERNERPENINNNVANQQISRSSATNRDSSSRVPLKQANKEQSQNTKTAPTKRNGKRRRTSDSIKTTLSRTKKPKTKKLAKPIELKEYIRDDENQYVVHPDFRLKKLGRKNIDLIRGMSKYDRENKDDVRQVSPYVADMLQYHYTMEGITRPRPYMIEQSDINAKMRAILVDWLIEVHMKFRLVPETLYLCINIIDRYCMKTRVRRAKLQLVGVTALLIACKYEEIYPPEVGDCVYITDSAYQREEVLNMEQDIVHKLGFRITVPTSYSFLQRYIKLLKAPSIVKYAASYYTERTLQEHDMLRYRPSLICAAAIVLALNNPDIEEEVVKMHIPYSGHEHPLMPVLLLEYTGFTREDIIECAEKIAVKVSEEPITASRRQLVAVKRKYDNKKYGNVSTKLRLPSTTREKH